MQYNYSIELIPFQYKKRKESDFMAIYQEKCKKIDGFEEFSIVFGVIRYIYPINI